MKTHTRLISLLVALGLEALLVTGCVNTGKGIQKDYQKAEDKVEHAVK